LSKSVLSSLCLLFLQASYRYISLAVLVNSQPTGISISIIS
jgi:hypothetical protein